MMLSEQISDDVSEKISENILIIVLLCDGIHNHVRTEFCMKCAA